MIEPLKNRSLSVIILAAGKGKRMVSQTAKVLHPLGGIPLLTRVVQTARALAADDIHVVYGNEGEAVRGALSDLPVNWVEQPEQLGTGHAVLQALPFCKDTHQVLVLYADVPLISVITLQTLLKSAPENGLGLIVAELPDPTGFGRIVRDAKGEITCIVEHKDASAHQLKICEINTGIMTASAAHFKKWLPRLQNSNQQKEYYLTDAVSLAVTDGLPVSGIKVHNREEVQGINDRWELIQLERHYQREFAKKLALSGVTIRDPDRLDVRGEDVQIGQDVVLDVNVILEGKIRIGNRCTIGPNVYLKDVTIADDVVIHANSVIEGATIHNHCQVGPFARIRPETVLEENAKVGNFVEMKKTTLGVGSKAPHLTYLGDATIGKNVNVGAGTITCNYDGANKSPTIIEDEAFIGSNSSLVAPVTIGKGATIGAGSTITQSAPADQLTLTRAPQKSVAGWKRPKKKE